MLFILCRLKITRLPKPHRPVDPTSPAARAAWKSALAKVSSPSTPSQGGEQTLLKRAVLSAYNSPATAQQQIPETPTKDKLF